VPYYICPSCGIRFYSPASWAYAPECPRCYEPLNRTSHRARGPERGPARPLRAGPGSTGAARSLGSDGAAAAEAASEAESA
jgi:hypothetical protein